MGGKEKEVIPRCDVSPRVRETQDSRKVEGSICLESEQQGVSWGSDRMLYSRDVVLSLVFGSCFASFLSLSWRIGTGFGYHFAGIYCWLLDVWMCNEEV